MQTDFPPCTTVLLGTAYCTTKHPSMFGCVLVLTHFTREPKPGWQGCPLEGWHGQLCGSNNLHQSRADEQAESLTTATKQIVVSLGASRGLCVIKPYRKHHDIGWWCQSTKS